MPPLVRYADDVEIREDGKDVTVANIVHAMKMNAVLKALQPSSRLV